MTSIAETVAALEIELQAAKERAEALEDGSLLLRAQDELDRVHALLRQVTLERDKADNERERLADRLKEDEPAVAAPLWSGPADDLEVDGGDPYEPDMRQAVHGYSGPVVVLPDWFAGERRELRKELSEARSSKLAVDEQLRKYAGIQVVGPVWVESMSGGADGSTISFVQETPGMPDMTSMLGVFAVPERPPSTNRWTFEHGHLDMSFFEEKAGLFTFSANDTYRIVSLPGDDKPKLLPWPKS